MKKIILFSVLVIFSFSFQAQTQKLNKHHDVPAHLLIFYDSYIKEGLIELEKGNDSGAIVFFNKAKDLIPTLPDAYLNLAVINIKQKKLIRAENNLERAGELIYPYYSQKNIFFYNKGLVEHLSGRHQNAYQFYTQAVKLKPEMAEAIYGRALIDKVNNDYPKALEGFILAKALFQKDLNILMAYRVDQKIAEISRIEPSLGIDLAEEARIKMEKGEFAYSILLLKELLEANPQDPKAHYRLGVVYAQNQEFQKAAEAFENATRYKKDFTQAYINAGSAYGSIQQYHKALDNLNKALSLEKNNPNIHYNLAMVYSVLGRADAADQHLKQAKELALASGDSSILANIDALSEK